MADDPREPLAFANHLPVQIRFGAGVAGDLPQLLDEAGLRRPFVVIDPNVRTLPGLAAILARLPVAAWHELVPGEPTTASVDAAGAALAASGADVVVAIGGGSALDTAKGARIVGQHGAPIRRFAWPEPREPIGQQRLPLLTVPTTAGTGSEVTGGVVMIEPSEGRKVAAPSPHNRARWALVDPELTYALPPAPTLYGGADALAQAIGPVLVRISTPVGDGLGLEGTRRATSALPAVVRDPGDVAARAEMLVASLLAGLAMNVAEAGTEHSLAHPLGALYGLPHGLAVGLMLAESLDHDRTYVPARLERIANAMGAPVDGSGDGSRAPRAVRALLREVGFPTLAASGVAERDVERLADAALASWIPVEPGPWTRDDARAAYRRALALGDTRG